MLEVLTSSTKEAPVERYAAGYGGQQYVGIDLHRRRSVVVRTTDAGELLEAVQITNSPLALAEVMTRAGERPEVVLEATYGWYWASDTLQECGAVTHLAHPRGVKAFEYRRVKNDVRDACDLADLLRMGRLPEAWIAPPATRELRELVRHRAKLVSVRSVQGAGPRGAGQVRGGRADERPVRRGRHRPAGPPRATRRLRGPDRLPAPDHGPARFRDRRGRRSRPRAAGPRPRLHRRADHPGDRPGP